MEQKHIAELQIQADAAVAFIWAKFVVLYPELGKFQCPKVVVCNRLKVSAGNARGITNTIKLSAELYFYNQEDFYKDTIPHELAHIVDYQLTGRMGHGPTWKAIMTAYGITPERCHEMLNPLQIKRDIAKGKVYVEIVPKMPILGQRVQWTHTTRQKVVTVYRGVVCKLNLKTFKVKDEKTGLEWGIPANTANWSEVK